MHARRWSNPLALGLLVSWVGVAVLMIVDHLGDPFDPAREGTQQYGHNHEGALRDGLLLTSVELVVFLAILRPWTPARSLGRAAAALVVFAPWSLASIVVVMHAGGIMAVHAMWTLVLTAVALVCVVARAAETLHSHLRRP